MNPKKLVRKVLPKKGIKAAEESYRKGRIYALQAKAGFPAKGLRVIAVTGTNGKTTTCLLINEMLKNAGKRTAMFTTALSEMDGVATPNTIHRTVPLTADLMKFFKAAKDKNVDFVVLETTSQALDQHKLVGVPIEVAVMTNLTQDHLDYHKTMEAYAASKARLFNAYCQPKYSVLNADDDWFEYFAKQSVGEVISYGERSGSTAQIKHLESTATGSRVAFNYQGKAREITTQLVGEFNAYNALAAAVTGILLGLHYKGVATLQAVPGRMEQVEAGQSFGVIVDYAHTSDALENVLSTLKSVTKGKVHIVFGATGDRDKAKRPIMGQVVAKLADKIYLTDDETYTEDPETIRREVATGINQAGGMGKTVIIPDRREAIAKAFEKARTGDVVLLAGIGHQDYRAMGGKNMPWDEREVAKDLLKSL